MEAQHFPQETSDFGAPPGFTKEEVFTLPVAQAFNFIRNYHPVPCLISCWQLTDEDWLRWKPDFYLADPWMALMPKEPNIWLSIQGYSHPVVSVMAENPFPDGYNKEIGKYFHENGKMPEAFQAELEKLRNQKKPE